MNEVLGEGILLSPIEPISPHIFFASKPIGPEDRQPLKSTATNPSDCPPALKSSKEEPYRTLKFAANGINRNDMQQEQALYTHYLAGVELLAKRPPSQNRTGNMDIDIDVRRVPAVRALLHSASEAMSVDAGGGCELKDDLLIPHVESEMARGRRARGGDSPRGG
ncbi:hypothetical protein ACLOAV_007082 [Pseudogymnoascus australis]